MTRCIHCTRCMRFTQEIAGIQELGMIGRGEQHEGRAPTSSSTVDHELSGNIIDLCPVGALDLQALPLQRPRLGDDAGAARLARTTARARNLFGHVLRGRLMRVVPRENEAINETWIADRDRFSYEGVYSEDRLQRPMIATRDGQWVETDWETALASGGRGAARQRAGVSACWPAPRRPLEELYLAERLARGLGSSNIDSRLRQARFPRPGRRSALSEPRAARSRISTPCRALLVVGANLRREVPILAHRVRKAARRGAKVALLNPAVFNYHFPVAAYLQSRAGGAGRRSGGHPACGGSEAAGAAVPAHLAQAVGGAQVADAAPCGGRGARGGRARGARCGWARSPCAIRASPTCGRSAAALAQVTGATLGVLAEGAQCGRRLLWRAPCRTARRAASRASAAGLSAADMLARPLQVLSAGRRRRAVARCRGGGER